MELSAQHYFTFSMWYFVYRLFPVLPGRKVYSLRTTSTPNTTMGKPRNFAFIKNVAQKTQHNYLLEWIVVLLLRTCQSSFSCLCVNAKRQFISLSTTFIAYSRLHVSFKYIQCKFNIDFCKFVWWLSFYAKTNIKT